MAPGPQRRDDGRRVGGVGVDREHPGASGGAKAGLEGRAVAGMRLHDDARRNAVGHPQHRLGGGLHDEQLGAAPGGGERRMEARHERRGQRHLAVRRHHHREVDHSRAARRYCSNRRGALPVMPCIVGRPAERAGARAAHDLVEGQPLGIGAELGARLGQRHVADVGRGRHVLGNRLGDVVHPLVVASGVVHARGAGAAEHAHVELRQVAVIDTGPSILAVADDPHQPVQGVSEHVRDDAAAAAVDDAGPDDHRLQCRPGGGQHLGLVTGPPRRVGDGGDRHGLVGGHRLRSEHPDTRRVDERAWSACRGQRRQQRVQEGLLQRRPARQLGQRRVDDGIQLDGLGQEARRHAEFAEHGNRATRLQTGGPLGVADQRGHVMTGPDEGVENRGADVAGTACEEHAHGIGRQGRR